MKKHTTKRALLMSALSLLVCVSMLVGSTFAWFTDSASSDRNIIQAGNLDVTLEYWDGDSYEEVTSSTKLFNDAALWEPGHAEVAYLRIDNAGSLALKYQLAVNVYNETTATNVAGETFKLSDHLVFSVVEKELASAADMYTREQAIAAAGNTMGLSSYNSGTVEMLPDDTDYVALIIYMPTSVGNEANYKTGTAAPTIELGTTLVATQLASEQDSWDSTFDKDATYPLLSSVVIEQTTTAPTVITAGDVDVSVPAGAEPGTYAVKLDNYSVKTDDAGQTSVGLDIALLKDGAEVAPAAGVKYPVSIDLGKNLEIISFTHKGIAVEGYSYDPTTGILSFETDSFSPFAVTYKEADADSVFVPSDPEAAEKLENDSVVAVDENGNSYTSLTAAVSSGASKLYLKEGADLGSVTHLDVPGDLVIYGNGARITGGYGDLAVNVGVKFDKDVTITVYNLHGTGFWGSASNGHALNLNLYNCNDVYEVFVMGTSGEVNIGVYNCVFNDETSKDTDTAIYSNTNGTIVVDGCTFNNVKCPLNLNHKIAGEQTVIVRNTTFVDCATEGTAAYYAPVRLYNNTTGANQTVTVSGCSFTYSEGKAPINNADVLLNAKHNGVDAAGTIKAAIQLDAKIASGANITELALAISDADDLMAFNQYMKANGTGHKIWGAKFVLTDDIDATGKTWNNVWVNTPNNDCVGFTFDGNGHTISNLTINGAMFHSTPNGRNNDEATVFKNLTFDNVTVTGGYHTAIIWDQAWGDITLENVHVVNSSVTGTCNVGALIGRNGDEGASIIKFIDCSVKNTTVTSTGGGDNCGASAFLGMALKIGSSATLDLTFENCQAENNTLNSAEGHQGGGIYAIADVANETWNTPVVEDTFADFSNR